MEKLKEYFKAQAAAVLNEVNGAIEFLHTIKCDTPEDFEAVEKIVDYWESVRDKIQGDTEELDSFSFVKHPAGAVKDLPLVGSPDPAPPVV